MNRKKNTHTTKYQTPNKSKSPVSNNHNTTTNTHNNNATMLTILTYDNNTTKLTLQNYLPGIAMFLGII